MVCLISENTPDAVGKLLKAVQQGVKEDGKCMLVKISSSVIEIYEIDLLYLPMTVEICTRHSCDDDIYEKFS